MGLHTLVFCTLPDRAKLGTPTGHQKRLPTCAKVSAWGQHKFSMWEKITWSCTELEPDSMTSHRSKAFFNCCERRCKSWREVRVPTHMHASLDLGKDVRISNAWQPKRLKLLQQGLVIHTRD